MASLKVADLKKIVVDLPDSMEVRLAVERLAVDDIDFDIEVSLKGISVIVATVDQPDLPPCLLLEGWIK